MRKAPTEGVQVMPYTRAETIGKTAPRPPRLDPASVGQVPRGEPADTYHVEAFWQAISHQAAARTARYGEASPASSEEAGGRISYHRHATGKTRVHSSHSLVQSEDDVAIGVGVFACITYLIAGGSLLPWH